MFLIGADTIFNVVDMQTEKPKLMETEEDNFLKFLCDEENKNETQIHGLKTEERDQLDAYKNRDSSKISIDDTLLAGMCSRPFIKLEFPNMGQNT